MRSSKCASAAQNGGAEADSGGVLASGCGDGLARDGMEPERHSTFGTIPRG
ncbi:MAG: hypothetical protein FWD57_14960 [Polyangiaceae bacterium]|nr:hypothetical protein [Polyangiaceae bacterium]